MKVYISGPMSGLKDSNFPEFHIVASRLRDMGYEVICPAENPPPPEGYEGDHWLYYMRIDLAQVCTVDAIVMLPNWYGSKGAREEFHVANVLQLRVVSWADVRDGRVKL